MAFTKIKVFNSRIEAEVAKSFLFSNGIEAQIQADDIGAMRPALAFSNGVLLLVLEKDADAALKILAKLEMKK